ncbi:hypothetical protein H6P81_011347 [Aristolochia fimbriata]|uniref:Uncharacterized protein n=1 Tax=Aristolochia fimbriata TaxID=158543 RepID=A0AAV7EUR5_ARIFI|nr:hypothetical protein H6P81_011347 [Aristolochia fimbriata]
MENMKDSQRKELLAMEARMQEQLQTQLQEHMQRFIAMMKTPLVPFDSSFSQIYGTSFITGTLLSYSGPLGITDSNHAEVMAVLHGLGIFKKHLSGTLEIEGGSSAVVRWGMGSVKLVERLQ